MEHRMRGVRGTTPALATAARQLRRELTPAERLLWGALRGRAADGRKWRRQYPVGPFVLDFFCPALRLAIEVDGPIHERQRAQDDARTEHLASYGYRMLRFRNDEVLSDLPSVLARIRHVANEAP